MQVATELERALVVQLGRMLRAMDLPAKIVILTNDQESIHITSDGFFYREFDGGRIAIGYFDIENKGGRKVEVIYDGKCVYRANAIMVGEDPEFIIAGDWIRFILQGYTELRIKEAGCREQQITSQWDEQAALRWGGQ